jgi:hypothetical protein
MLNLSMNGRKRNATVKVANVIDYYRVNIGNAKLYRIEEDLKLKGNQYQTAVSLLFVTYLVPASHPMFGLTLIIYIDV